MTVAGSTRIVCDSCGRGFDAANPERVVSMVPPWRVVTVQGWIGDFHACSDACEAEIAARYERPIPVAAETLEERGDDTVPSIQVPGEEP